MYTMYAPKGNHHRYKWFLTNINFVEISQGRQHVVILEHHFAKNNFSMNIWYVVDLHYGSGKLAWISSIELTTFNNKEVRKRFESHQCASITLF